MRIVFLFIIGLSVVLSGCDRELMNRKITEEEFSIKGLLDSLHLNVAARNPLLIKHATIDGEHDSTRTQLDSTGWNREFQIFNDLKIRPARLEGRYEKVVKEDSLIHLQYIGNDPKDLQLDSFFVTTNKDHMPVRVLAYINYSNTLNATHQRLQIDLQPEEERIIPTRYTTKGWQKLKLKDTVHFVIESRLEY